MVRRGIRIAEARVRFSLGPPLKNVDIECQHFLMVEIVSKSQNPLPEQSDLIPTRRARGDFVRSGPIRTSGIQIQ